MVLLFLSEQDGNTPASAGKSVSLASRWWSTRKYPRECGEESATLGSSATLREIPPRVRGRAARCLQVISSAGNTPASAGKRASNLRRAPTTRKYPRECGEECGLVRRWWFGWEIPPRVRGRARRRARPGRAYGNTPASAGKRGPQLAQCSSRRKYPRECGEERRFRRCGRLSLEIPPRVRGRARSPTWQLLHQGNTPASAGKR